MRVGIISADAGKPTGGQGVYTDSLTRHLRRRGIIATAFPGVVPFTTRMHTTPIPREIAVSTLMRVSLKRWARLRRLDLIHIQSGPGGVVLVQDPEIPVVSTAHHLYSQQHRYLGRRTVHLILMEMEKRNFQISQKVIAVSKSTKTELERSYLLDPEKIRTIYPGIDPAYVNQARLPRIPDSVLFVGQIGPRKGIGDLTRAFKMLKEAVPRAELYVVGRSSFWPASRRLIAVLTSTRGVRWLGHIPKNDLVRWYHQAEVLVLPSLFEGLGLVSLEAMAAGTPVVGTRVPGTVEAVQPGTTGLLAEPRDPRSLADCLTQILLDKELSRKMGREAKRQTTTKFNRDECATKTIEVYEEATLG